MKSDSFPECPFPPHEQLIIREHIVTLETLGTMECELAKRTFGKRVFRSARLRNVIARTRSRATAERDYHGELLRDDNLAAYEAWREAYTDAIDTRP